MTKRIKKQANNLLAHRNKVRSKEKKKRANNSYMDTVPSRIHTPRRVVLRVLGED